MKMNSAALGAALLLLVSTVNVQAGLFTDFPSWSAVVPSSGSPQILPPVPNIIPDPETNVIIPGAQYFDTGSVSYGGVNFSTSGTDVALFNIGPGFEINGLPAFYGNQPVLSSQQLPDTSGVPNILITLAAPVKAFALNFDTFNGSAVSFKLSNDDKTMTLGSAGYAYDLGSFFGVVDDTPFKWILLTSSDPVLSINGLHLGPAVSPIPEPATWVMLLLGFFGVGVLGARLPARRALAS